MNEEYIDKLAFEAGCHRHKYWDPKHPDLEGFIISRESLDKFAELIVRECVSKIGDEYKDALDDVMEDWDRGFLGGLSCAMDTVQKHFGVDE